MKRKSTTLLTSALLFACICFLSTAPAMAQGKKPLDGITAKYLKMGGSKGDLGAPSGSAQSGPHGGRFRAYQNGAIYWSAKTGAHAVTGAAFEKYKEAGGAAGALGYPVRDAVAMNTGSNEVVFQHGFVVLNETGEAALTTTPWATFTEHEVTVAPGVKVQTQTVHTALLLPPLGGPITITCMCAPNRSIELGACSVTVGGDGSIRCRNGSCRNGCVVQISNPDNK